MIKWKLSNRITTSTYHQSQLHSSFKFNNPLQFTNRFYLSTRSYSNSSSSSSPSSSSSSSTTNSTSSSSISPPPTNKRALVDLALIATGVISIGTTLIWLKSNQSQKSNQVQFNVPINRGQFEIPIASHTGSPGGKKTLTMLSNEETDSLLKKYEATFKVDRTGNPVYRYDTNHVASNSPIEDDSICTIMTRDQFSTQEGDMLFFGVFDGHSGWQTSKLLVNRLVQSVKHEISLIFKSDPEYVAHYLAKEISQQASQYPKLQKVEINDTLIQKVWSILTLNSMKSKIMIQDLDQDDQIVKKAIENAFIKLDEEIVNRPIKMLKEFEDRNRKNGSNSNNLIGFQNQELTPEQTASLQALLPALSGSCALLAYIDTARSKVHVACTGDSRAVMGVWNPSANGGKGQWHGELLSDDQEGLNPKEVERIRSEHPPAERENVIRRGRILGGLQPTRAFGDARYKWPVGMQEKLYATFHPSARARRDPPDYLTPPYVTAKPEVTSTSIPTEIDTNKPAFIVLATDGLWDRLETSEVVGLVGSWIDLGASPSTKSIVMKKDEVARVKVIETSKSVHDPSSGSNDQDKKFIFEDGNVATHLIRNALGGPSREKVSALLSIPAPHSRRYRDDITVTVIFLDPEKTNQSQKKTSSNGDGVTKIKPELIGLSKL